ncbi:glucose-6-phosphate isomerase [uncultured Campylobacter sp.]|uniref:glucose-6-phosphate isomerase n=1 Tax=uncultured Campylobacter sp. TaxID=218934 RepID=UPI0028ECA34F|nr:glucose-6-phosphate isomerase [uncultured Campylobacter sp.]
MVKNELFFPPAKEGALEEVAAKIRAEYESGEIGYYSLPQQGADEIARAQEFFSARSYDGVVLIGIGGSSVGVRALYEMLRPRVRKNLRFEILDNLDALSVRRAFEGLNFARTIFIISSKSGGTIETISLFKVVLQRFGISDLKTLAKNFIFITDVGSPLDIFARGHGACVINMPANVGGRFSVLSAVGLVPAVGLGLDASAMLRGAAAAKERYLDEILAGDPAKIAENKILRKAHHYATHKSAKINVLFSYGDALRALGEWYVQLWAESLGKKIGFSREGLTPVGLVGSRDQHSFLQLIMDGVKDKTVTFLKLTDNGIADAVPGISLQGLEGCDFVNGMRLDEVLNLQCDATLQAVLNEGISVDLIEVSRLCEQSVGELFYYFELLTSATGAILGVSTYDQPGVEVGKRILKSLVLKSRD